MYWLIYNIIVWPNMFLNYWVITHICIILNCASFHSRFFFSIGWRTTNDIFSYPQLFVLLLLFFVGFFVFFLLFAGDLSTIKFKPAFVYLFIYLPILVMVAIVIVGLILPVPIFVLSYRKLMTFRWLLASSLLFYVLFVPVNGRVV